MTHHAHSDNRADALVVFGLTGDLGHAELLPGIVLLHATGRLGVPVVGVGRHSPDDVDQLLADAIDPSLAARCGTTVGRVVDEIDLRFVEGDATDADTWRRIADTLTDARLPSVYAALPPALLGDVAEEIARSPLSDCFRLVLEKPFGHDRASALELHERITDVVDEDRLFLVDHFLAKAPVRNLVTFRRSPVLDIALRAEHVERIVVDFPEPGGLEDRGSFYEGVGGVVPDVVQNHLLQTVASALLEPPPVTSSVDEVRRARLELLRSMTPAAPDRSVRGQYDGYRALDDVADDSTVPTYVELELDVETPRWQGVPVVVRTGKRVADGPFVVEWQLADGGSVRAQMKPDASIQIELDDLDPDTHGIATAVACTPVRSGHGALDAYATVLGDALVGERRHMSSIDEIVESWRIVAPLLDTPDAMVRYTPGTPLDHV